MNGFQHGAAFTVACVLVASFLVLHDPITGVSVFTPARDDGFPPPSANEDAYPAAPDAGWQPGDLQICDPVTGKPLVDPATGRPVVYPTGNRNPVRAQFDRSKGEVKP